MSEKNNSVCSICDKGYYACLSCKDAMKLKPWQTYCCSSDCYKVFQVVRGFSTGVYNKEEFKSKLQNIDLSGLDSYRENIKSLIKDALKEEKEEVFIEAAIEPVVEDVVVENAEAENVVVNDKTSFSRKRYFKTEIE